MGKAIAAVGMVITMIIAFGRRGLAISLIELSLLNAQRTTAKIMLVVFGVYDLNFVIASKGVNRALQDLLHGLRLGPLATLIVIVLIFIVLGFFIETLSLMVATIPIVVPVVILLGYDKIWFGILMIILVEMALITPPVGLNLYVVKSAPKYGSLTDVMIGCLPYTVQMIIMIVALIAFPEVALFLPSTY